MSTMYDLLYGQYKSIPAKISGLAISYSNCVKLLGSSFVLSSDNILQIYLQTIKYYNAGFGKESSGSMFRQDEITTYNYISHLDSIFANEHNRLIVGREIFEMTPKSMILMNYPSFVLFLLIGENKHIRQVFLAEWEDYITLFVKMIYDDIEYTFKERKHTIEILPFEIYKRFAYLQVNDINTRVKLAEQQGFEDDIFLVNI